ncbi:MAG: GNAT family N-acetyltransferase [Verrucomicrobia bacterium]|nr:GNAT family N-acetyltransferase [Verrucomicrobiota bacterium]
MPESSVGDRILARAGTPQLYASRLASRPDEVRAAQSLRFLVFNIELNEGLEQSFATCLDADPFDEVCEHLLVEHLPTHEIVGTYRLQTGRTAAAKRGYYSSQEFDFAPFEPIRGELIELGRACVHSEHRNLAVLGLLWKGIAAYARERGGRYLIGCSSLTSQDPLVGASMFAELSRTRLAPEELRTRPRTEFACPLERLAPLAPKVPKLLSAYLSIGAKICGPPAIDREFKTIDFLTLLDLQSLPPRIVERYLS